MAAEPQTCRRSLPLWSWRCQHLPWAAPPAPVPSCAAGSCSVPEPAAAPRRRGWRPLLDEDLGSRRRLRALPGSVLSGFVHPASCWLPRRGCRGSVAPAAVAGAPEQPSVGAGSFGHFHVVQLGQS